MDEANDVPKKYYITTDGVVVEAVRVGIQLITCSGCCFRVFGEGAPCSADTRLPNTNCYGIVFQEVKDE